MTKEDILKKHYSYMGKAAPLSHIQIYAAMDEWAAIQTASNSQALCNLVYETCNVPEFIGQQTTVGELRDAIGLYAELQATKFFKCEIAELKKLLEYDDKVGEPVTGQELIRAITTFQNSNTDVRYKSFLQDQSKQQ